MAIRSPTATDRELPNPALTTVTHRRRGDVDDDSYDQTVGEAETPADLIKL